MKKFKFRLQSVLDARAKELEDKQIELSVIQATLKRQIKQLEQFYQTRESTRKELELLISEGNQIDFFVVNNYRKYIDKLSDDIQNQKNLIEQTKTEVEEKKQEVVEALKSKTMLDKLKEKDLKAFLKNMEEVETKEIDEIALARHLKKA